MTTKSKILNDAIEVLRRSEAFTIDAVARESGLTKPGVIHHFPTKEALVIAVVDRIVDRWVADMDSRVDDATTAAKRLRAYVEHAVMGEFDQSDLALLTDVRLRDLLSTKWTKRLDPWFGTDIGGTPRQRASLRAARLLADGAWFNKALGIPTGPTDETAELHAIAIQLLNEGEMK